jgi:signal transduction histidine kinase
MRADWGSASVLGVSELRPGVSDAALAAGLLVLAQVETWTGDYTHPALVSLLAFAATAPLAWRRRVPLVATSLVIASLLGLAALGQSDDPVWLFAALLVASYSAGASASRMRALAGLAFLLAFIAVAFALEPERGPGDVLFVAVVFGGVWWLAQMLRLHRSRASDLERETVRLERERDENARRAVAEERAHIARELHDVVAHSVSVMVVQTGAVRRRIAGEHPEDGDLLEEVEQTGRQAMAEMRRLLGLLRSEEDAVALTPQPGIASLPSLVEQLREAGLPVELRIEGDERPLPPGVDVAAYRIAQEALTNALRHGGGAPARVRVAYGRRRLELAVDDDGPGSAAPDDGRGHGLVGMRERVALYGGRFEAGPRPDGGFAVRATLELDGDER